MNRFHDALYPALPIFAQRLGIAAGGHARDRARFIRHFHEILNERESRKETCDYVAVPLLITGLANEATPLSRRRIGDVGTRSERPCPCGRPGDVFREEDGRIEDRVLTRDRKFRAVKPRGGSITQ